MKEIDDAFLFGIPNFFKFISEFLMEEKRREVPMEQILKIDMLENNEIMIIYKREIKNKFLKLVFEDPKVCLYVLAKFSFLM